MTDTAKQLIEALAMVSDRFGRLAEELGKHSSVAEVRFEVAPRHYANGARVEAYVDAELISGNSFGVWFETRHEAGSWIVESSIRINTNEGEDELQGLPSRFAVHDAELIEEMDGASAMVCRTATSFDLAQF